MNLYDDEDDQKEEILKALSGEVDDFAGSQIDDPDKPDKPEGGVTVTISVSPGGEAKALEGKETPDEEEKEEHDPIGHILGMCGGGCKK